QDNSSKANISNEEKMDDKSKSQGDKNQTGGITAKTDQKMAKKTTGKQALPKTGQAELTSFLISLGGLVSLGMAVSVRRKENQ
ncbi:LPXTG cell wall anchor domain-containing protein, partial [Streptococcus ruminantium]